jgi:hypothetical protein
MNSRTLSVASSSQARLATGSKGFAQDKDVIGKIALLDKRVGPKRPDKFAFLQLMAAVADQQHKGVKGLGV